MNVYVPDPSTVPAFQDKLVSQLLDRDNLADTSIVIGPPSPGVAVEHTWICLLEVKGTEKWSAVGRRQKEEDYTQQIYISVLTRDGEGDSVRGRDIAYGLRQEIANQLLADPTVGMTVWQAQLQGKQEFLPRIGIQVPNVSGGSTTDMSWRESALYCEIEVMNRLETTLSS